MVADPKLMTGLGAVLSLFLASAGAARGTVPAGTFALRSKNAGFRSFYPIMSSGILAIYGTILAVILSNKINDDLDTTAGYKNFTAGLATGLACLVSGHGLGSFIGANLEGNQVTPTEDQKPLLAGSQRRVSSPPVPTIRFLMIDVFFEVIGLYGFIVGLLLAN
jgi:V-type H+-transporting ATPase proteolipid subunit